MGSRVRKSTSSNATSNASCSDSIHLITSTHGALGWYSRLPDTLLKLSPVTLGSPAMGLTLSKKCRSFRVLTGTSKTGAGVCGGFLSFLPKEVEKNQIPICLHFGLANREAPCTMAKRSTMFDDPIMEIQELTSLIKNDIMVLNVALSDLQNDIMVLNVALSDLQTIQNIEIADGKYSEGRVGHTTAVLMTRRANLWGLQNSYKMF